MYSYFDQFNVVLLAGEFITNVTTGVVLGVIFVVSLSPTFSVVPSSLDIIWQGLFEHWHELIVDNVGSEGINYLPGVLGLFTFLLAMNVIGFFPYTYTVTAQVLITFSLSFTIVLSVTVLGVLRFSLDFFSMWMPQGAPMVLSPLLVLIETVSYFSRALSLGLSLAANLSAGHLLMIILGSFTFKLGCAGIVSLTSVALIITLFVITLEIAVAVIQAYVFCLLTCVYLADTTHLH